MHGQQNMKTFEMTLIKVHTSGFRTYFIFRCCQYHQ